MRYFRSFQIIWGLFAITLLPCQISAQPEDVRGWNRARWGMTEREIENTFKGKVKRRREPIIDKQEGIYVNQEIHDLTFAHTKFTVSFVMDDKTNQLMEVVLTPKGSHFRVLFGILENKLVTKYGPVTYKTKMILTCISWAKMAMGRTKSAASGDFHLRSSHSNTGFMAWAVARWTTESLSYIKKMWGPRANAKFRATHSKPYVHGTERRRP